MPPATVDLVERLRAAGCVFAEEEAALLVETAVDGDLERLVAARASGTPLEQLLGWADFAGVRVILDAGVFVPRQRTALLVELAAGLVPEHGTVVDLCCGSGALLLALQARRPDVDGWASDLDPAAVRCARRNLGPDRVLEGDLYDALSPALAGRVDVLLVNAPYVPTEEVALMPPEARDHEHRVALDGGPDGLDVHRRVAAGARGWLAPGGALLIEVSAPQVGAATQLLKRAGLDADVVVDDERETTALIARGAGTGQIS